MIPRLGSMPRLQLSHPDSWHNWNTCLNRPQQHAFRIHTSNLFKITPKKGIVTTDHSRNTITYHNALCLSPKILHKHCLQFLRLGVKMAPRENENNAYAKFWGDKQRVLWYVMVFPGVVNREEKCGVKLPGSNKGAEATATLLVVPLINGRCHF